MYKTDQMDEEQTSRPNKSALKREAAALFELGARLLELESATLHSLELPKELISAINHAKTIHSHTARKRQLKLIGKHLRSIDTSELIQLIEKRDLQHQKGVSEFHHIEKWRDRLIQQGTPAITELLERYPHIERQKLNQLVRSAIKEARDEQPPGTARMLFRFLKEEISTSQ